MAKGYEDSGDKFLTPAKATKAPSHREYPLRGPEARDVAIRRLAYRDIKMPSEYEIWKEFRRFPEVLAAYEGPAGDEAQLEFEERFQYEREQAERRVYGRRLSHMERGSSAADGSPWK